MQITPCGPDLQDPIESKEVKKKTEKDPDGPSQLWRRNKEEMTKFDHCAFALTEVFTSLVCDLAGKVLNKTHIKNGEDLLNVHDSHSRTDHETGKKQGLLTVSNHTHYIDAPFVLALMMQYRCMRSLFPIKYNALNDWNWVPAEKENFFNHPDPKLRKILRTVFGRTKAVPITRGVEDALNQLPFKRLEHFLKNGDWVHIFGEGTRAKKNGVMGKFKPGLGKLIKNAPETMVLPFGHDGIQNAIPHGISKGVYEELHSEEHKLTSVMKTILETNKRVKSTIEKLLPGKSDLDKMLQSADSIFKTMIKTRKDIQIVVGEPMNLSELANEVPDNKEGYMVISDKIRAEVENCYTEAIQLNQERKSA